MSNYVAFLRGINVSSQKLIKMADLSAIFMTMGFKNVKTYIQSGNVVFKAHKVSSPVLKKKLEKGLQASLGYEVLVAVRTLEEIRIMVQRDPFVGVKEGTDVKKYVTFLLEPTTASWSPAECAVKSGSDILYHDPFHIFWLSFPVGNGRYGFPNQIAEKALHVPATTRNWSTVLKIAT
ncbi:MAG: DUF1697 domain-containing protein [Chthoniobacterales bacterium]